MNLKIKDLIYRQNNFVPKEVCKYFIDIFKKYEEKIHFEKSIKFTESNNNEYVLDNFKCLNLSTLYDIKEVKEAADIAYTYISTMIFNYTNFLKINISKYITNEYIKNTSNIRILKYSKGEQILDHLDISPYVRASCTLNLNEDYTGGEFTFFSGKHIEIFKTGDAMIFPAEPIWIHGTKPIISGERYAINCFLTN